MRYGKKGNVQEKLKYRKILAFPGDRAYVKSPHAILLRKSPPIHRSFYSDSLYRVQSPPGESIVLITCVDISLLNPPTARMGGVDILRRVIAKAHVRLQNKSRSYLRLTK